MWVYYGLFAAFFLSLYNLCKKWSVRNNAVLPVLIVANGISALLLLPVYFLPRFSPDTLANTTFFILELELMDHVWIALKALLMTCSWILAYSALKHLPISIVSPIRASSPFFTLLGAIFLFGENPIPLQWVGFILIILSIVAYSYIGRKEGISFKTNRWFFAVVLAMFFGACSGLYDKFLLQMRDYSALTLLWCFFVYITIFMSISFLFIKRFTNLSKAKFQWRWSIFGIASLLLFADYFYFTGLRDPEALVMLMSAVKRSQLLFTIVIGGILFKERNLGLKLLPLFGVLIGVFLILFSY
ncbi:EamA family transporter [Ochrovirga pacifica]|uniref:EamA family transporter n=1 Tax=Ochrovirga pacifica TaxID=1042376 RepID=UPI0002558008|nr:EamA family transporter [Ochrovirga pacifica]